MATPGEPSHAFGSGLHVDQTFYKVGDTKLRDEDFRSRDYNCHVDQCQRNEEEVDQV